MNKTSTKLEVDAEQVSREILDGLVKQSGNHITIMCPRSDRLRVNPYAEAGIWRITLDAFLRIFKKNS